jgi:hypothetical protein
VSRYQLAQLNIAKMKFAIDDPGMSGFVARLDDINALADSAPGFVWRLQTEEGDATGIDYFGTDSLVNMSVWTDLDSLHGYIYRSAHNEVMALRKQWFDRMTEAYSVLWWVAENHIPTLGEASDRLECLRGQGPGPNAFTFKQAFDPQ